MELSLFAFGEDPRGKQNPRYREEPDAFAELIDASAGIAPGPGILGKAEAAVNEGATHTVEFRITCEGLPVASPMGSTLTTQQFGPSRDGGLAWSLWIPIGALVPPVAGTYAIALHVDGVALGRTLSFELRDAPNRVVVIMFWCAQDSQGKDADGTFLTGRVNANVIARNRSAKSVFFTVKQSAGGSIGEQGFEIGVPKEYTDLLSLSAFRTGVEKFYRDHAVNGFGGDLTNARDVLMQSNLIQPQPMVLQLELPAKSEGGW